MSSTGWKRLLAGVPGFRGAGNFPIAAYSEFMPPPRVGLTPYGAIDPSPFHDDDPWGWQITEYEEEIGLREGLESIAHQVVSALAHLGRCEPAHGISKFKLTDNPYWPPALAERAGSLEHERYVVLLPLALSLTQDDKGRVRWTLFGGSEQGPARAFWRSFLKASRRETPASEAIDFCLRLLSAAYGVTATDLHRAGFRILAADRRSADPHWPDDRLPSWTVPFHWKRGQPLSGVRFLLTFHPFGRLPAPVQQAYFAGDLHLLPFPGSLVFWGIPPYFLLQRELPLALQIPLLHMVARHAGAGRIRVPQSGWLHEPRPDEKLPDQRFGPIRGLYRRSHRNARVLRDETELPVTAREDKLAHVLFSAGAPDVGLYGKPMARNAQLWTHDFHLLLDGPKATREQIERAAETLKHGGLFGYRFLFPAMRVGLYEVYWHRPLVAYWSHATGQPAVLPSAPLGYLTAYRAKAIDVNNPVELWPRLLRRDEHLAAVHLFEKAPDPRPRRTTGNVRKLLDTTERLGGRPIPRSLARSLLTLPKDQSHAQWLDALPGLASDPERGRWLAGQLRRCIESEARPPSKKRPARLAEALTYDRTGHRSFEVDYWNTIAALSHGDFRAKNNADCAHPSDAREASKHSDRDLESMGSALINHYTREIEVRGLTGTALVGDLPFHWRTDFDYMWSCGWINSQMGLPGERDVVVVIPGRDRSRAVIMADHYDTAYMEDHFAPEPGKAASRIAAAGADDNCSATAALMLAAPVLLDLSRAGRLGCDVWLVHLTGEEFPADCLGARHLASRLVEGTLELRLPGGRRHDLSQVRVQGVYVLDMVAHNNDHDRDVFQIAPGASRESMWLAYQAHMANEIWNASTAAWNRHPSRRGRGRSKRRRRGLEVPDIAQHLSLRGEVRPHYSPRSTLYNTDGQIFSDAGIPVVLFMENYDINRKGYHDSHDTMANIDLDYGAAVAAIAIESVARAATEIAGRVRGTGHQRAGPK